MGEETQGEVEENGSSRVRRRKDGGIGAGHGRGESIVQEDAMETHGYGCGSHDS